MEAFYALIKQFGRLRLTAMVISALPLVVLPLLGTLWLWQSAWFFWWLLLMLVCGTGGYLLHKLALQRDQQAIPDHVTEADPNWPPAAQPCWDQIDAFANDATPADWPLNDGTKLMQLARQIIEQVAHYYHPKREQPLLELTLPHTLTIIERAARELRQDIVQHLPFSHRLTLGTLSRAKRWKELASQYETWFRMGRAIVSPQSALFSELRRSVGNEIMEYGSDKIQTWLLREYIRKVGFHAIALYSGNVLIDDAAPTHTTTASSRKAEQAAATNQASKDEPLHILLVGHANAGKSSLINALFGELTAATDRLPDTTAAVTPYLLEVEGETRALIYDTPGCDTDLFKHRQLKQVALDADLILWVTAANRADRQQEKERISLLKQWLSNTNRRPPPLMIAMSHIDQLRPIREWQPPYDLNQPDRKKAANIVAAMQAVSESLQIPLDQIIPVCLAAERTYNVEDALWAAILGQMEEANRVRFLRCMRQRQKQENWELTRKQLANAGRLLYKLPSWLLNEGKPG